MAEADEQVRRIVNSNTVANIVGKKVNQEAVKRAQAAKNRMAQAGMSEDAATKTSKLNKVRPQTPAVKTRTSGLAGRGGPLGGGRIGGDWFDQVK